MKALKKLIFYFLLILPFVIYLSWCAEPAIRTYIAKINFPKIELSEHALKDLDQIRSIQRKIQKHFLNYRVYIPIEDIILVDKFEEKYVIGDLLAKACGDGILYVWLPYQFRIPPKFQRFYEQCWIPNVKIT